MLDGVLKHRAGPTKTVAGIEQAIDLRSAPRPLLDLVEIAQVGDQRIGGLLVEVNVVGLRIGHGPDNRPIGAPPQPSSCDCYRALRVNFPPELTVTVTVQRSRISLSRFPRYRRRLSSTTRDAGAPVLRSVRRTHTGITLNPGVVPEEPERG